MQVELATSITQQQFGDLVGISGQAVSELVSREVLTRGGAAGEWLLAYCANLREQAAGRAATGDLNLATERAALARAQRERVEMQNAVTRRELAPIGLLEQVLARVGRQVAGILEALPSQLKRRAPHLTQADYEYLSQEIARARNLAAAVNIEPEELNGLAGDPAGDQERPEAA